MARSFNSAVSDHVSWSGGPILYNQTAASIACWFNKATMTASAGGVFLFDQQAAFNKRVDISIGDGTSGSTLGKWTYTWRANGSASTIAASTNRWDDGAWHRLLLVRRNSSPFTELYIDAVSEGSSTTDPGQDATAIGGNRWGDNFQGGDVNAFGSNGNGSIGRGFFVSGTTLTPAQADHLLFTATSLVAPSLLYEFGNSSPETDFSGNGLSGTVSGTAVVANGAWGSVVPPSLSYAVGI